MPERCSNRSLWPPVDWFHAECLIELGNDIPQKSRRGQKALRVLVKNEIARWTPIIQAANVKAE
jgi:hypothetical protein